MTNLSLHSVRKTGCFPSGKEKSPLYGTFPTRVARMLFSYHQKNLKSKTFFTLLDDELKWINMKIWFPEGFICFCRKVRPEKMENNCSDSSKATKTDGLRWKRSCSIRTTFSTICPFRPVTVAFGKPSMKRSAISVSDTASHSIAKCVWRKEKSPAPFTGIGFPTNKYAGVLLQYWNL